MSKSVINSIDRNDWWLLFIDKKDHRNGANAYDDDNSHGFYQSMMKAMDEFLANDEEMDKKIDADKYDRMYETIAKDDQSTSMRLSYEDTKKPLRESYFTTHKIEGEALRELQRKKVGDRFLLGEISTETVKYQNIEDDESYISQLASDEVFVIMHKDSNAPPGTENQFALKESAKKNSSIVTKASYNNEERKEILNDIFNEHYAAIDKEENDLGKIAIIADTVRSLHVMHPFVDGNGRLNMPIVMNNLLCDAGFCPSILPEGAEVFSGYKPLSELTTDISTGMNEFMQFTQQSKIPKQVAKNVAKVLEQLKDPDTVKSVKRKYSYNNAISMSLSSDEESLSSDDESVTSRVEEPPSKKWKQTINEKRQQTSNTPHKGPS